eukprot:SAG31_NODE_1054_length_10140_cov_4.264316_8_plen_98_part_00
MPQLRSGIAAAVLTTVLFPLNLVQPTAAKFVSGSFHLDAGDFVRGPEYEIAKYSFNMGKAHVNGKIRFKTADSNWMTSPALYLFNDNKWGAPVHGNL